MNECYGCETSNTPLKPIIVRDDADNIKGKYFYCVGCETLLDVRDIEAGAHNRGSLVDDDDDDDEDDGDVGTYNQLKHKFQRGGSV
jgi:hypothetical protein